MRLRANGEDSNASRRQGVAKQLMRKQKARRITGAGEAGHDETRSQEGVVSHRMGTTPAEAPGSAISAGYAARACSRNSCTPSHDRCPATPANGHHGRALRHPAGRLVRDHAHERFEAAAPRPASSGHEPGRGTTGDPPGIVSLILRARCQRVAGKRLRL